MAGVSDKGGNLRVGLYNASAICGAGIQARHRRSDRREARHHDRELPASLPGDYGIKVLQDENSNGKMDTKWGMIPAEPYGFSNDAPAYGPADWDAAKITLKPAPTQRRCI